MIYYVFLIICLLHDNGMNVSLLSWAWLGFMVLACLYSAYAQSKEGGDDK